MPRLPTPPCLNLAAVMPRDVHAVDPAAVIATHALRALAVMAAFESTRAELAHSSQLVSDIGECVGTGIGVGWCACVCVRWEAAGGQLPLQGLA